MLRPRAQVREQNLLAVVVNDGVAHGAVGIVKQRSDLARIEIKRAKRAAAVRLERAVFASRGGVVAEIRVPMSVDTRLAHGENDFVHARHPVFFELFQQLRRRGRVELFQRRFALAQRDVVVIEPASVFKRDFNDVRSFFDRSGGDFDKNRLEFAKVVLLQVELTGLIDRDDRLTNLLRRDAVGRNANQRRLRPVRETDSDDKTQRFIVIARAFELNFQRVAIPQPAVFHRAEMPRRPEFVGRFANDLPPDFFALLFARFAPVVKT